MRLEQNGLNLVVVQLEESLARADRPKGDLELQFKRVLPSTIGTL